MPQPIIDYTTSRVLTMEFVPGTKITELTRLERLEVDGERLADALFRAYLKQILRDGFFHADPHPGNVFLIGDGASRCIDLGMVARLAPALQEQLLQMLLAVSDDQPDEAAKALLAMGECREDADTAGFQRARRRPGRAAPRDVVPAAAGRARGADAAQGRAATTASACRPSSRCSARRCSTSTRSRTCSRRTSTRTPRSAATPPTSRSGRCTRELSLGSLFSTTVELKDFVAAPAGARQPHPRPAWRTTSFEVKVDAIDETRLMEGMQKIANRIALGLVLAALIVGAALMMHVPTSFRIFGYPGLAIMFFLAAAGGGDGARGHHPRQRHPGEAKGADLSSACGP